MMKKLLILALLLCSVSGIAQATAYPAPDILQCNNEVFNLTVQTPIILGNQPQPQFNVGFFETLANAQANINPIATPAFFVADPAQIIYARVTNTVDNTYDVTSFNVSWNVIFADQLPDVTVCDSYQLPELNVGNYFTEPGGTGTMFPAGINLTTTQSLYIYAQEGGCTDETSFVVTIIPTPTLSAISDVYACESYTLPALPVGEYHTAPGGTGQIIPAGTVITSTKTIYVYAQGAMIPNCSAETSFVVDISHGPGQITPSRVNACVSYTLPSLPQFYSYYIGPNQSGTQMNAGQVISETTTIYVFAQMPTMANCSSDFAMSIEIGNPAVTDASIAKCDDDGDGFVAFDLDELMPGITNGLENVDVTFHETQADAIAGVSALISPYINTTPSLQTIWARVQNGSGDCFTAVQAGLNANPCASISGVVRNDTDLNGCSVSDPPATGIHLVCVHNNQVFHSYTNEQGEFVFSNVPLGISVVNVAADQLAGGTVSPTAHTFNITETGNNIVDFCITPLVSIGDAAVYFYQNGPAVPGFQANYVMVITNVGGAVVSGSATVNFDPTLVSFTYSSPLAPNSASPGTLTFNFPPLAPYATIVYGLHFQIATPPTVEINDMLTYNADVTISQFDNNPYNNHSVLNQTVVNSYDPNDIAVSPGSIITEAQIPNDLVYTIRFQNLGNANAVNVRIENTLDSELDWSTFRPLTASHSFTAERNADQVVFRFNNINLPGASQNEAESHGMISYAIKPVSNFATAGDWIENFADIYFDFNAAVTTNTVTTSLVALGNEQSTIDSLEIYPNPAHGQVNIHFLNTVYNGELSLSDIQGKLLKKQPIQSGDNVLDISNIRTGLYFLRVQTDGKSVMKKLIIK